MMRLFWSERYWRTHFDATPPGLISGPGSGVGRWPGSHLGPFEERQVWGTEVPQSPTSVAYTRKDFSGHWSFRRGDELEARPVGIVPRHVEAEAGPQAGKL